MDGAGARRAEQVVPSACGQGGQHPPDGALARLCSHRQARQATRGSCHTRCSRMPAERGRAGGELGSSSREAGRWAGACCHPPACGGHPPSQTAAAELPGHCCATHRRGRGWPSSVSASSTCTSPSSPSRTTSPCSGRAWMPRMACRQRCISSWSHPRCRVQKRGGKGRQQGRRRTFLAACRRAASAARIPVGPCTRACSSSTPSSRPTYRRWQALSIATAEVAEVSCACWRRSSTSAAVNAVRAWISMLQSMPSQTPRQPLRPRSWGSAAARYRRQQAIETIMSRQRCDRKKPIGRALPDQCMLGRRCPARHRPAMGACHTAVRTRSLLELVVHVAQW